jgi:hypothetical protein
MRTQPNSSFCIPVTARVLAILRSSCIAFRRFGRKVEGGDGAGKVLKKERGSTISGFVSAFLRQAQEIFETAAKGGGETADWTILIHANGAIGMVAGRDWDVEALRVDSGACSAYRISRNSKRISLEGRAGGQTCRLESERREAHPGGLPEFPRYRLAC